MTAVCFLLGMSLGGLVGYVCACLMYVITRDEESRDEESRDEENRDE
jgi:hypothetical protein